MLLAGVALLVWVLLRRVYRKRSGRPKSRIAPQSPPWRAKKSAAANRDETRQPLIDAPPEILRWQLEMHETARDLKAELDTKIHVVQTLVGMACEESQRLEAAIDQSRRLGLPRRAETLQQIEELLEHVVHKHPAQESGRKHDGHAEDAAVSQHVAVEIDRLVQAREELRGVDPLRAPIGDAGELPRRDDRDTP
jgi:hypothetical protein